jgi:carbon monoxide dehydrogenase subunit G
MSFEPARASVFSMRFIEQICMRVVICGVILCGLGWPASTVLANPKPIAKAPAKPDARTDRLVGFTRDDLERLAPQLARGPVALVEFADSDSDALPGIHIAAQVDAPAAKVLEVVRNPDAYPRFLPTLDEVTVLGKSDSSVVYDWRWEMAVLTLEGRNTMSIYEPSASRVNDGYRVTIDSTGGDLGAGRIGLRILPTGKASSTLVVSMRIDLRQANYVARQLAAAARSVNRSANIALTCSMLLGFRAEAERRAGVPPRQPEVRGLVAPEIDPRPLVPLLMRGDLVLLDLSATALERVAVLGVVYQPEKLVREVMLDAKGFGAALMPGSSAKVVARDGNTTTFDWEIDLPLVGVSGQMQMHAAEVVEIEAVKGALDGGRWLFSTREVARGTTLVTGWARFDLAESAWLVRRLSEADPNLGHGLTVASEVMLVRALRSRSGKRAEELARK